jgi:hypothetical protein
MAVDKDIYKQILVTFTHEQVQKIETFWHENKLKNRNEAIRMLVEKGYVIKNDLTLFSFSFIDILFSCSIPWLFFL